MSFRTAALLNVALFVGLFLVLCFTPHLYLAGYGVPRTDSAEFITRRASPMFLGLAWMLWFARALEPSPARILISDGTAILLLGIAATGLYSLVTGAVGPKILVGVAVEVSFASALWLTRNRA